MTVFLNYLKYILKNPTVNHTFPLILKPFIQTKVSLNDPVYLYTFSIDRTNVDILMREINEDGYLKPRLPPFPFYPSKQFKQDDLRFNE